MLNIGSDRSPERAREDYVKAIYQLGNGRPVRAAAVARYLGVSRASMSQSKPLLERARLIKPSGNRTDALALTARGQRLAVSIVRRHRLVETFLHRSLALPLEDLHRHAESIEHAISDDIARRLDRFLGYPTFDPHGHAIPRSIRANARAGHHIVADDLARLSDRRVGERIQVVSVDDRDRSALKELSAARLVPGAVASITGRSAGATRMRVGARSVTIPTKAAMCVNVRSKSRR